MIAMDGESTGRRADFDSSRETPSNFSRRVPGAPKSFTKPFGVPSKHAHAPSPPSEVRSPLMSSVPKSIEHFLADEQTLGGVQCAFISKDGRRSMRYYFWNALPKNLSDPTPKGWRAASGPADAHKRWVDSTARNLPSVVTGVVSVLEQESAPLWI